MDVSISLLGMSIGHFIANVLIQALSHQLFWVERAGIRYKVRLCAKNEFMAIAHSIFAHAPEPINLCHHFAQLPT